MIMGVDYIKKKENDPLLWFLQPKVLPNHFHLFAKLVVVHMKFDGCNSIAYKNCTNATFYDT